MSRAGFISRIFRGLFASRLKGARIVGEDHLGNRYFEKNPDGTNRKGSRWVEARGQEEDATFIPEVPPEWDSWLRRRRDNPPTQEELDRNYAMMVRTQHRARELEQKGEVERSQDDEEDRQYTETVTQDSFKSKFPQYEDFEIKPGQFKGMDKNNK